MSPWGCVPPYSPLTLTRSRIVRVKIAPHHKGSPLCSCVQESGDVGAGTHRKRFYCRSKCWYFLNWSTWRASDWEWTEGCVCARVVATCVWVRGLIFGLWPPQRAPMCCYQPLGLWDWQMESRNKAVCSFPGTSVWVRVLDGGYVKL